MVFPAMLKPSATLTDEGRQRGLKALTFQTIAASGADGLASGGFLAAFALILGASNFHIGIMAAIPSIMQPLQIAAVVLVERLRMRKVIAVPAYFTAFATWVPIGLIPFVIEVPHAGAVALLLFFTAIRGVANAFVNTSWTSWLRDLVPADAMGGFFAQRMRVATTTAAVAGLSAAFYIDWWKGIMPADDAIYGYSYAILLGSILLGFSAAGMMGRIPEPRMTMPEGTRPPILQALAAPLRDANFRQLITFLLAWSFVANLAVPFFSVYMLTGLGLSLTVVVVLGVLSQITNVLFLRVWGPLVDLYGSKVILSICTSLYFLVILGWTFTTLPGKHALTIPLLILLHSLIGIASAGINVSSTTIRMKLAPPAQATAYLTSASLAASLGAGISPLLGGAFVDFFSVRHLSIAIEWVDPVRTLDFPAIFLTGYDFLFASAFVLGLFAIGVLGKVREEGEVQSEVVMDQLMSQTRENLRALSSVPGLSTVTQFPLAGLRYLPDIPGLNVAAGVTAYQLASSARYAIERLLQAPATARQVQTRIGQTVTGTIRDSRDVTRQGTALAFGAAHGAVHATGSAGSGTGRLIRSSLSGTLGALGAAGADPFDSLRGAVYGAIHGAGTSGLRVGTVVRHSLAAVRRAASQLDMSEQEAVRYAAKVAVEAASDLPSESQEQVREAVLHELMAVKPPALTGQ